MISIILFYKCGYYILENKIKSIISKQKKRPKLTISNKIKKNEIYKIKKKKIKIKKIFKNSNPLKKVKKSNKNIIVIQEKTDKSKSKLSKLKPKNDKFNIYREKDSNQSSIPLRKYSDRPIKLNLKLKNNKIINSFNDFELNSLNYKDALEIDKRTYLEYYIS